MIEITKKEALSILKAFHVLEGAMIEAKIELIVIDNIDAPCKLLSEKIINEDTVLFKTESIAEVLERLSKLLSDNGFDSNPENILSEITGGIISEEFAGDIRSEFINI